MRSIKYLSILLLLVFTALAWGQDGRLVAIKAELDTDPLVRGYLGMTAAQVQTDMNSLYRDAPADGSAILQYLALERFRAGTLYGRIKMVADSRPVKDGVTWTIPPLPLGVADVGITPTMRQITSANSLLAYAGLSTPVSLNDSRFGLILDDLALSGVEAIGAADKIAIQALSQNKQSRSNELGLGRVTEGEIVQARALP